MQPSSRAAAGDRADSVRQDISRAALRLFLAEGHPQATVERIAEAAGVSARTFHRHFPAKEDVLMPIFRASTGQIAADVAAAAPEEPVLEVLVRSYGQTLTKRHFTSERLDFYSTLMSDPAYLMRWRQVDGVLRRAIRLLLVERLGADPQQYWVDAAAELLAHAGRSATDEWMTRQRGASLDTLLRTAFSLVLNGLPVTAAPITSAAPLEAVR